MKWRLPDGSPFVGNERAKQLLSATLTASSFPHAILIEGPVGSGRRTLARLIAAAAVCTGGDELPCGECPACRKAARGVHPDITEIDGDGGARSFHIDTVRTLREDAYVLPNEAPRRVFLLADIQNMTEQAQNALLKILEEPPASVVFILTCERRSQVLETVLSRVFTVTLGGVSQAEALPILQQKLPDTPKEDLLRAAQLFGGVIGQAIEGLSDGSYRDTLELVPKIGKAIVAPTELQLLKATAPLEKNKEAADAVLCGLQLLFRDALVLKSGGGTLISTDPDAATHLSRTLTQVQLLSLLSEIEELQISRQRNINYTLFLTVLCARLRRAAGR